MTFEREKQRISANEILQAIASGEEIKLSRCTVSGDLDINRLLSETEHFNLENCDITKQDKTSVISISERLNFNACIFEL